MLHFILTKGQIVFVIVCTHIKGYLCVFHFNNYLEVNPAAKNDIHKMNPSIVMKVGTCPLLDVSRGFQNDIL